MSPEEWDHADQQDGWMIDAVEARDDTAEESGQSKDQDDTEGAAPQGVDPFDPDEEEPVESFLMDTGSSTPKPSSDGVEWGVLPPRSIRDRK